MGRYLNESDVYGLLGERGMAMVHCSQIDELPRANVVPKTEWISVDERLPEELYGKYRKQIRVLVCTERGKVSTATRQRAVHFDKSKLVWVELGTFEWSGRKHVTHWMPLPEPPDRKGGAE
jgi:hypothetical protein